MDQLTTEAQARRGQGSAHAPEHPERCACEACWAEFLAWLNERIEQ